MQSEKFRICVIVPPGYVHASCFVEVAYLLKSALGDLGYDCDTVPNQLAHDRTNVLLGGHLMQFGDYLRKYRYIPYQLEQLSAQEGPFSDNLSKVLENAAAVWDYSVQNIEFMEQRGIRAVHLPVGYHRNLERVVHTPVKDIDLLFYGSCGPRRQAVLDLLQSRPGITTKLLFGVYGHERDRWIGRSGIVLNIHHYGTKIFEAVRISYLLNNRCFVLSEESTIDPYPGVNIYRVPYDGIVDACLSYATRSSETQRLGRETYEDFRSRFPMTELVGRVLG